MPMAVGTRLGPYEIVAPKEIERKRYVAPYDIAVIYAGLKETEQTFKYLEMAYQDRSFWMIWLRIDPRFDSIRGDPRYHDLLRRMHLEL